MDAAVLLVVSCEPFVSNSVRPLTVTGAFTPERFDYSSDLLLYHRFGRFAKR